MFGEKTRQVAELRNQLAAAKADPENDKIIALAQEIHADVSRLTTSPGMDVDKALSIALANATEHVKHQMFADYIAAMPYNEVFRAYAEQIGDSQVQAILADRALREYQQQKDRLVLEALQEEAMRSYRLDLSKLPFGSMVEIGFFYKSTDEKMKTSRSKVLAARILKGRVDNPKAHNKLTIYEDELKYKIDAQFDDGQVIGVGSRITDENGGKVVVPTVTHGMIAVLNDYEHEHVYSYPYDIGYVEVNGMVVLDTPEYMKELVHER